MISISSAFARKVGSAYYTYHLKGRYDERAELENSLHHGKKWVAKKEAELYRKWQNAVNNAHAITVKKGTVYVVYIRNKTAFRSMADASAYVRFVQSGSHPASEVRKWLQERGYA